MNNKILFTEKGWAEYCYWQTKDKKTLKKINRINCRYCKKWF